MYINMSFVYAEDNFDFTTTRGIILLGQMAMTVIMKYLVPLSILTVNPPNFV